MGLYLIRPMVTLVLLLYSSKAGMLSFVFYLNDTLHVFKDAFYTCGKDHQSVLG